jgi:hypothetical protein
VRRQDQIHTFALILQVAVSDFLTLFSARTGDKFFWRTKPAPILLFGACFSLAITTLIACVWGDGRLDGRRIEGLSRKGYGIWPIWCWIYCIIVFLLQDAGKARASRLVVLVRAPLRCGRRVLQAAFSCLACGALAANAVARGRAPRDGNVYSQTLAVPRRAPARCQPHRAHVASPLQVLTFKLMMKYDLFHYASGAMVATRDHHDFEGVRFSSLLLLLLLACRTLACLAASCDLHRHRARALLGRFHCHGAVQRIDGCGHATPRRLVVESASSSRKPADLCHDPCLQAGAKLAAGHVETKALDAALASGATRIEDLSRKSKHGAALARVSHSMALTVRARIAPCLLIPSVWSQTLTSCRVLRADALRSCPNLPATWRGVSLCTALPTLPQPRLTARPPACAAPEPAERGPGLTRRPWPQVAHHRRRALQGEDGGRRRDARAAHDRRGPAACRRV